MQPIDSDAEIGLAAGLGGRRDAYPNRAGLSQDRAAAIPDELGDRVAAPSDLGQAQRSHGPRKTETFLRLKEMEKDNSGSPNSGNESDFISRFSMQHGKQRGIRGKFAHFSGRCSEAESLIFFNQENGMNYETI